MKRVLWILAVVTLVVVAWATIYGPRSFAGAGKVEVRIDNFTFTPATITVPAGTEVLWTNRDDIPHTVVSDDKKLFKSKALDTDEQFSFTFSKPGTYSYFCSIHPKMTAKIVVE